MKINKGISAILGVFITLGVTGTIAGDGVHHKHNYDITLKRGYSNIGDSEEKVISKGGKGTVLVPHYTGDPGKEKSTVVLPALPKFKGIEPDEID